MGTVIYKLQKRSCHKKQKNVLIYKNEFNVHVENHKTILHIDLPNIRKSQSNFIEKCVRTALRFLSLEIRLNKSNKK